MELQKLQIIQDIVNTAVWAPSGDNSQPWKFVVRGDKLCLYNLPDKDMPFFNYRQFGSLVSHGAIVENIVITSPSHGYVATPVLFPNSQDQDLVAEISFASTMTAVDPLEQEIPTRSTNRKPYKDQPLTVQQRQELQDTDKNFNSARVVLIEDPEVKQRVAAASSVNEMVVLETQFIHSAFFGNLVWSEKEELVKRTGLYLATLELSVPQRIGFRLFKFWPVMNFLNKLGLSKFVSKENTAIYASSAAMAAIVIPADTQENYVTAGRLMQRLWLTGAKHGLSMQPLAGVLFFAKRVNDGQAEGLAPYQIDMISKAASVISEAAGASNESVALLLRLGDGGEPSARSSRRIHDIIVEQ